MLTNADFNELLNLFVRHEVRFLVVGGYAVMKYSEPRFTKDIDLWIATDEKNARAVYEALKTFGAPLTGLRAEDFEDQTSCYQMGRAPLRVDIMMSIPGVQFEACWPRRETVQLGTLIIPFISREDLITAKEASGRPEDLLDVKRLREAGE